MKRTEIIPRGPQPPRDRPEVITQNRGFGRSRPSSPPSEPQTWDDKRPLINLIAVIVLSAAAILSIIVGLAKIFLE